MTDPPREPKPRRDKGAGALFQRADGRWYGSVRTPDGKRKTVSSKSKRVASQKLAALIRDLEAGRLSAGPDQTLCEYLTGYATWPVAVTDAQSRRPVPVEPRGWLGDTVRSRLRYSTYRSYERAVRLYIVPSLGAMRLSEVGPEHVERMLADMARAGKSADTRRHARLTLVTALNKLVRWRRLPYNVAALVESPAPPQRRSFRALKAEEMPAFIRACASERLGPIYLLAMTTGLREGELFGLEWKQVDLAAGLVRVTQQMTRVEGEGVLSELKRDSSLRTIPLPALAVAALRLQWKLQREERRAKRPRWPDMGLVFTSREGGPLVHTSIARPLARILAAAGLPHIRFHDLRHSYASAHIRRGTDPKTLQALMGHASIGVTMDVYGHVFEEGLREAVDRLDDVFGDGGAFFSDR